MRFLYPIMFLLIMACSNENLETDMNNAEIIHNLEKKYNLKVLSAPPVLTDSIVAKFEQELLADMKKFDSAGIASKKRYDSLKHLLVDNIHSRGWYDNFPIRHNFIDCIERFSTEHCIIVRTDARGPISDRSIYASYRNYLPSNYVLIFHRIRLTEWDDYFKEMSYAIDGSLKKVYGDLETSRTFDIVGVHNHYDGIAWLHLKFTTPF